MLCTFTTVTPASMAILRYVARYMCIFTYDISILRNAFSVQNWFSGVITKHDTKYRLNVTLHSMCIHTTVTPLGVHVNRTTNTHGGK